MLLNENRNRVPELAADPVDGTTEGKVGDLVLVTDGTPGATTNLHVCVVAGSGDGPSNGSVWAAIATS